MIRSRRMWAASALPLAALLALSGCSRGAAAPDEAESVDLTSGPATGHVTIWAQGVEAQKLPEVLAPFLKENPDLTVDVTELAWASAESKYQTSVAGNTTPDIGMLGTTWIANYPQALQAVPEGLDTSDMFPSALEAAKVDGVSIGVPLYLDTRVVYYRTDLAQAAGYDTPPTDWEGFQTFTQDMQSKAGSQWGIGLTTNQTLSFSGNMALPWSAGGDIMNADQTEWTLDSPAMNRGFEYYKSFFDKGIADPAGASSDVTVMANEFISGKTPVIMNAPFFGPYMTSIAGDEFNDKWGVMTVPKDKSSTSFLGGALMTVFKESKNPEASWKVLQYLAEPSTQLAFFKATGDLPATQSTWQDDALTSDPRLAVFGEQLKAAEITPNLTTWAQISSKGDQLLEQIARGQSSVDDALAELQTFADGLGTGR
ncbi:Cyclodextrin-binding protein precursor [Microbacterium foliorum]|uniref:Cyclodextrin-binding protein n=1 Tax=Microbacterium foliorum TaxID=104336 RepID=A0A0F0KED6_9MICO|nr:Cyclodextrin-binding protein precursor [Microbacterium foliorum]